MSAEVHSYAAAVAEVGSVGEEEAGFFNHLNGILDWEVLAVDPGEVGGFDLSERGHASLISTILRAPSKERLSLLMEKQLLERSVTRPAQA